MVLGLVRGVQFSKIVESMATARPDKPCNNVGCDEFHISDDCHLQPMCSGCGLYGSHFSHECAATCLRCGAKGHTNTYCLRQYHRKTHEQLQAQPVQTLRRPANDPPRQIGSPMEQIWAEVASHQSVPADGSATQASVPRLGTIPSVLEQGTAKSHGQL